MKLEHQSAKKLQKAILTVIGQYLNLQKYKVFFFGSRVSGKSSERSDIDVGIEGPMPVPLETFSKIEEELEELPTLYKIEIVDFGRVAPKFKEIAKRQTELINK